MAVGDFLGGSAGGGGDKALKMGLADTIRLAWADDDLRGRLIFVFTIFAAYALGIQIRVPIPGIDPAMFESMIQGNQFLGLLNALGGGGLKRISIFALGLNPYITASIVMQIAQVAFPNLKEEMKEGGEYARKKNSQRTRMLSLLLCVVQGWGIMRLIATSGALPPQYNTPWVYATVVMFWMAGSMLLLWMGEQISEKGVGNGISLMIFAGIVIVFPNMAQTVYTAVQQGSTSIISVLLVVALFVVMTWFIVFFTIAQRRLPITPLRRQVGTKAVGGSQSYLPFSLNMTGVIPIIFAISLVYMPYQFANWFPPKSGPHNFFMALSEWLSPNFSSLKGLCGALFYMFLIFFFTYFYTAIQYNVDDIADNLKRQGAVIPGVRPGKQTRDFLDSVISRITLVGAVFLSVVALNQYIVPLLINVAGLSILFGTSLLIMVSVALETMRQIEASLLMKQYNM
ncbi:MAG: preprotein translocase subunit SecY [Armatimonadetes bacterium]|nr:preprotein translocase subunit SecY [Armatimonadota bacterium]